MDIAVLRQLAGGAWDLAAFSTEELARAHAIVERYADQSTGLADASIVVLAGRHQTRTVVTLDRRHFGVVRPIDGGSFEILPWREPRTRPATGKAVDRQVAQDVARCSRIAPSLLAASG